MVSYLGPYNSTGVADFALGTKYDVGAVLVRIITLPPTVRVETDTPTNRYYGFGWCSLGGDASAVGLGLAMVAPMWIVQEDELFLLASPGDPWADTLRTSLRPGGEADFFLVAR